MTLLLQSEYEKRCCLFFIYIVMISCIYIHIELYIVASLQLSTLFSIAKRDPRYFKETLKAIKR